MVCPDSCALPVAFVPTDLVLASVSGAVAGFARLAVSARCAVSGPDLPALPEPWSVLVAAAIVDVPVPAECAVAPVLAAVSYLNLG